MKIFFMAFIICVVFVVTTFSLVDFFQGTLPQKEIYFESMYFHSTNLWNFSSLKELLRHTLYSRDGNSDEVSRE